LTISVNSDWRVGLRRSNWSQSL